MSRVFIPQVPMKIDKETSRVEQRFNTLDKLAPFGEVVVLMDRNDDVWNPDACLAKLRRGLRSFGEEDYFLAMGNHLFCIWAAIIASESVDVMQNLQWSPREGCYKAVKAVL